MNREIPRPTTGCRRREFDGGRPDFTLEIARGLLCGIDGLFHRLPNEVTTQSALST